MLNSKYGEYENGVLYTLTLCTNQQDEDSEPEDLWLPVGICLSEVVAFRMAAPDEDEDGEIAGKVRIDTRRDGYTLYIPFGEFKNFFREWKQTGVGLEPKS